MIPKEIQILFDFIDFLDSNKKKYIEFIPYCEELHEIRKQQNQLKPRGNYKDKQQYDELENKFAEKILLVENEIEIPFFSKLKELGIRYIDYNVSSGGGKSSYGNEIQLFIQSGFTQDDIKNIFDYKDKYLSFRKETKNVCELLFPGNINDFDDYLKPLFEYFKDTKENEFAEIEPETVFIGDIGFNDSYCGKRRISFTRYTNEQLKTAYINIKKIDPKTPETFDEFCKEIGNLPLPDSFVEKEFTQDEIDEIIKENEMENDKAQNQERLTVQNVINFGGNNNNFIGNNNQNNLQIEEPKTSKRWTVAGVIVGIIGVIAAIIIGIYF